MEFFKVFLNTTSSHVYKYLVPKDYSNFRLSFCTIINLLLKLQLNASFLVLSLYECPPLKRCSCRVVRIILFVCGICVFLLVRFVYLRVFRFYLKSFKDFPRNSFNTLKNFQGVMNLPSLPIASFDPEGLIFAVGMNSDSIKLYDVRTFDKVIW